MLCRVFNPVRLILSCVDEVQRDVPDLIVLPHVVPVGRAHHDAKERSVSMVYAVGRLWVGAIGHADEVGGHDILQG